MATHRMIIGRLGEDLAASFLERRGALVVGRNRRVGRGEIDLLVDLDSERVAVEVKTSLHNSGRPEENFDDEKERNVRDTARRLTPPVRRVDLITVVFGDDGATVRWLPGAG